MDTKENRRITISTGWWGCVLSIAIIAIRAFQPGAEPMSSWSATSWVLMTIPITFPMFIFAAWGLGFLALAILSALFRKRF